MVNNRSKMVWSIVTVYVATFLAACVIRVPEDNPERKTFFMAYVLVFTNTAMSAMAIRFFHKELVDSIKTIGLKRFLKQVILSSVIVIPIGVLLGMLSAKISGNSNFENQEIIDAAHSVAPVLMFITTAVCAPIAEETIFRFLLQDWLKSKLENAFHKYGAWIAILISGIAFGELHSSVPSNYIVYIGVGIALGITYEKTGSYAVVICVHMLNNLLSMIL